jgi:DNA polymerase III alpha subunit
MKIDQYGRAIVNSDDVFAALYNGSTVSLGDLYFDNQKTVEQFNHAIDLNADSIPKLKLYQDLADTQNIEQFDALNQSAWFMPKDYCPHLVELLFDMCKTTEQTERVSRELEMFIQHNMMDLLYYLKYLVDTMRENNIVWGVGRGSSVASYVLYLLGVHKIDSIKYDLDIKEFLK